MEIFKITTALHEYRGWIDETKKMGYYPYHVTITDLVTGEVTRNEANNECIIETAMNRASCEILGDANWNHGLRVTKNHLKVKREMVRFESGKTYKKVNGSGTVHVIERDGLKIHVKDSARDYDCWVCIRDNGHTEYLGSDKVVTVWASSPVKKEEK